MSKLADSIDAALRETIFDGRHLGKFSAQEARALCDRSELPYTTILKSCEAVIPENRLTQLAEALRAVMTDYIDPESQRVGVNLCELQNVCPRKPMPMIGEFARTLVGAAAILGPERTAEIVSGWIAGEPFRMQHKVLLTGVAGAECTPPLTLDEGIHIIRLPDDSARLPPDLLRDSPFASIDKRLLLGGTILAVDITVQPALRQWKRGTDDQAENRRPETNCDEIWANGKIPYLNSKSWFDHVAEALSLACDHYVNWACMWRDKGENQAFGALVASYTINSMYDSNGSIELQQTQLDQARNICLQRHQKRRDKQSEALGMAIRRWRNSKRPRSSLSDRFIELRIAFEALYLDECNSELSFRLAIYGAWDLGADFDERQEYFELLRKFYSLASTAVHAGTIPSTPEIQSTLSKAQRACRKAILKRLASTEEPRPWREVALGGPVPNAASL